MKKFLLSILLVVTGLVVQAEEPAWKETLGKVKNLSSDTGIAGFMKKTAPAYITGEFDEADRPAKPCCAALEAGTYTAKDRATFANKNGFWVIDEDRRKTQRAEEREEDAELRGTAQERHLRVRDQRTEVRHRTDTHEDQRRQYSPFIEQVEIVQQTAGSVWRFFNRHDDVRIDVDKQHAECNRNEKERLKVLGNCKIQEYESYDDHDVVSPSDICKRGLFCQVYKHICDI